MAGLLFGKELRKSFRPDFKVGYGRLIFKFYTSLLKIILTLFKYKFLSKTVVF